MRLKNFFRRAKAKLLILGLTITAFIPAVLAEEGSTVAGLDLSGLINLVMAILPLFIVMIIIKAILDAFSKLG
ncbi:hypothetical protein DRO37_09605 [Candidatus Bathyarchaeota archaeon]|nr:MAG: hypothetical protein DRO37_09605 [Candidatus Bathyarchaeota archaeon]